MLYNFIQVFNFNPLPRKEGDLAGTVSNFLYLYFNPLPRKEGDDMCLYLFLLHRNFNPLPRKEGDSLVKRETANIAKIQLKS